MPMVLNDLLYLQFPQGGGLMCLSPVSLPLDWAQLLINFSETHYCVILGLSAKCQEAKYMVTSSSFPLFPSNTQGNYYP